MAKDINKSQEQWERKTQGKGATFERQVKDRGYNRYTKEFAEFAGMSQSDFQAGQMATGYNNFVNRTDLASAYDSGVAGKGNKWKENLLKAASRK